jgi:hypothetical protein
MESQNKAIAKHLNEGNTITPLEALNLFGCFRLSARIYDLRKLGLAIEERAFVTHTNKRVSQYWIQQLELFNT